jgi:hypothetical protein
MIEMMILGSVIVLASFFFILWVETILSDNEFIEVEEWQEFQQSMNKKGNK